MGERLAVLIAVLALSGNARAESDPTPTPTPSEDSPPRRLVFAVATLSGEFGTDYAGAGRMAVLVNPTSSGFSVGGSVFLAPITSVPDSCALASCTGAPLLWRWMADARFGTPDHPDRRTLVWVGLSAGATYMTEPGLDVSPVVSLAAGGDVRMSAATWFELSLRATWAQMIGPGSSFATAYFTFGLDVGVRLDFVR